MKKYYIALTAIGLFIAGMGIYTIYNGISGRQDIVTLKKAQDIAEKLNSYVSKQQEIPKDLSVIGVKDVPDTITYTRKSSKSYEFCVTYRHEDSSGGMYNGGIVPLGGLTTVVGMPDFDNGGSYTDDSYLYISTSHAAGKNCQTIKPYIYNYNDTEPSSVDDICDPDSSYYDEYYKSYCEDLKEKTDSSTDSSTI